MSKSKAVVIGAGVGGLSSAAKLAQTGKYDVALYERMSFAGGRFTQHNHDGFQIPTGAVHMIPHGRKGPFSKLILGKRSGGGLELGRHGVEFLPSTKFACQLKDGRHYAANSVYGILRWFPAKNTLNMPRLLATRAKHPWENETIDGRTWLQRIFTDDFIDFLEAFSNFAISLRFDQMPASTVVRILQNSFWSDRPHIPKGGCKGVIDGLRADLKQNGAKIKLSHEVTEILPGESEESTKENRFCIGIRRRGRDSSTWVGADSIIHNGGHPNLLDSLSEDFEVPESVRKQVTNTQAVGGIGFVFDLDEKIPQRDSGVTMIPSLDTVGGYVIPTFSEPALAPPGRHMMITHQYVPDPSVKSEIAKGRDELYDSIPWLSDHGEELCVHTYHRNWPCNRAPQGAELPSDIGVEGMRLVGDGIKGHGWMMVEGIASNVPSAVRDVCGTMDARGSP
ncbi:MAG: NAD(P)-binding protein [Candidatus Thalassarchaeaceae archaeon]|nr:NAD(P)-binding protein [Candidatus Thalassarchaeaceae archaeon]MDP6703396.1 NAD(P)-binding protein [Candidatus Thalassarchaeaceae archaeon]MDP7003447.1 NAD(P)-binding protein [Candidatus Thalassarchaeaceae archaeon]